MDEENVAFGGKQGESCMDLFGRGIVMLTLRPCSTK
jgi:hypothetical protein